MIQLPDEWYDSFTQVRGVIKNIIDACKGGYGSTYYVLDRAENALYFLERLEELTTDTGWSEEDIHNIFNR